MTRPENVRPDTCWNPSRVRNLSALPDPTRPDPARTYGLAWSVGAVVAAIPNVTQANARARRRLDLR